MHAGVQWRLVWVIIFSVNSLPNAFSDTGEEDDHVLKHEVFLLNLEHGYFGCQVNSSSDILQIFDISLLCDQTPQCFFGSDEVRSSLKCTDDCEQLTGHACENGVCLEGQCHCSDKFGGLGCEIPDENECKYRPCDIFASCVNTLGSFQCNCLTGYEGDGFRCTDIDECKVMPHACGLNAECHNLPGHYECFCKKGYAGDPLTQCNDINECEFAGAAFPCGMNALCTNTDGGYRCHCLTSYTGSPNEKCVQINSHACDSSLDCPEYETCSNVNGTKQCVPGCSKFNQICGPNAVCVTEDHISSCRCKAGYQGLPYDAAVGCQVLLEKLTQGTGAPCVGADCDNSCADGFVKNSLTGHCIPVQSQLTSGCTTDEDCAPSQACILDGNAKAFCVEVCGQGSQNPIAITCPTNTQCVAQNHKASCQCIHGFTGNTTKGCYPVAKHCVQDTECAGSEKCVNSACEKACQLKTCDQGAVCVSENHRAICKCASGSRTGAVAEGGLSCVQTPCVFNDDCQDDEICDRLHKVCVNPCSDHNPCGGATCVSSSHKFDCVCPAGYSISHVSGEIGCTSQNSGASGTCDSRSCHPSAMCVRKGEEDVCTCRRGQVGNPYTSGCIGPTCAEDKDCPTHSQCRKRICSELSCDLKCGSNAACLIINHSVKCVCNSGFEGLPDATVACVRSSKFCENDLHCETTGSLCINNECKLPCNYASECAGDERCVASICMLPCKNHGQCPTDEICATGYCVRGCRTNADCPSHEACRNHRCADPCKTDGQCGPNAICHVQSHASVCSCPEGFSGIPSPIEGCLRISPNCSSRTECPSGHVCVGGSCLASCDSKKECAGDEVCKNNLCMTTCFVDSGCKEGHICMERTCQLGCRRDSDCPGTEECIFNKCRCGAGFMPGLIGCVDLNECSNNPCSPGLNCLNTPGSFKCICPDGALPSAEGTCSAINTQIKNKITKKCTQTADCPEAQTCVSGECEEQNACALNSSNCTGMIAFKCFHDADCSESTKCSSVTNICHDPCDGVKCRLGVCSVQNHTPICRCEHEVECAGHEACHQGICTELCVHSFECPSGSCLSGLCNHHGANVSCLSHSDCADNEACTQALESRQCQQLCLGTGTDCPEGTECYGINHEEKCRCVSNFGCLEDEVCVSHTCEKVCLRSECGANAECFANNHEGRCQCKAEYTGDPAVNCRPLKPERLCANAVPGTDSDACVCTGDKCFEVEKVINTTKLNLHTGTCKEKSDCTQGQECQEGECVILSACSVDADCGSNEKCIANTCRVSCLPTSCDISQTCSVKKGRIHCACKAGTIPNPAGPGEGRQNCVREPTRSCDTSSQCSSHFACVSSVCKELCASIDNCLSGEKCVEGVCHTTCLKDSDCADGDSHICDTGICVPGCNKDTDCAGYQICERNRCINSCLRHGQQCGLNALCKAHDHQSSCYCPYPLVGDAQVSCSKPHIPCVKTSSCPDGMICADDLCRSTCDSNWDCMYNETCVRNICHRACASTHDCGSGQICDSSGACTGGCDQDRHCPPNMHCVEKRCKESSGKCKNGYEISEGGSCVCPVGKLTLGDQCVPCSSKEGWILSVNGTCICDSELILDANGDCVCPPPNEHTPASSKCRAAATTPDPKKWRTDFPSPEMTVNCLADGIQVDIAMNEGILKSFADHNRGSEESLVYVKGYSGSPECRKSVPNQDGPIDFKVKFGNCGLTHSNGEANFVLVIQKHMRLVTHTAQAFNIKCVYMTGEKVITLDVDVSMITTMGTIANTGPPPNCFMRIVGANGEEITSAQIGDLLTLRVEVLPSTIYGGFVRNCVATTMDSDSEKEYYVTDANGCALEPTIFGDWEIEHDSHVLFAHFNAFKFPGSSSIKFQCNVRVCFGRCHPVICPSSLSSYGRKKRDVIGSGNDSQVPFEGQLREEVTVYSNPILAIERPESRLTQSADAQLLLSEEVCVSSAGFVVALAVTGVSAILTVSIALLLWIFCRRKSSHAPLKHPAEFPNPLVYSSLFNPVPDYAT